MNRMKDEERAMLKQTMLENLMVISQRPSADRVRLPQRGAPVVPEGGATREASLRFLNEMQQFYSPNANPTKRMDVSSDSKKA